MNTIRPRIARLGTFNDYFVNEMIKTSQGPIGQISPTPAERLKGFIPEVVDSPERTCDLDRLFFEGMRVVSDSDDYTRLSIRAVVRDDLIHELRHVEARIPLQGDGLSGFSIVYQGHNKSGRNGERQGLPPRDKVMDYFDVINKAKEKSFNPMALRRRAEDVTTGRITRGDVEANPESFVALLGNHGYKTPEAVLRIVDNEANIVVAAYKNGQPAGITVGEVATINLDTGQALRILEITDSTVLEQFQNNGVYSAVSSELLRHISENHRAMGLNVVYAETVITAPTLNVAATQGRHFDLSVFDVNGRTGVPFGMLPYHAKVGEDYETLVVNYLTRQDLDVIRVALRD